MSNITLYYRHKLQIPESMVTRTIDKNLKKIFKFPKSGKYQDLQNLITDTESMINELFKKYIILIK